MNIMKIEARRVRDESATHMYRHTAEMVRSISLAHGESVKVLYLLPTLTYV